jgi:hypothetical protein
VYYLLLPTITNIIFPTHLNPLSSSRRQVPLLDIDVQRNGHVEVDVAHAELELLLLAAICKIIGTYTAGIVAANNGLLALNLARLAVVSYGFVSSA